MVYLNPALQSMCDSFLIRRAEESQVQPAAFAKGAEGLKGQLPRGSVWELSGAPGSGKTELVFRLLAKNPEVRVAWIERKLTAYPIAFAQARIGLERVLFVECPELDDALWAAHQILRSQLFSLVVLERAEASGVRAGGRLDEKSLRRLQLEAEKSQAGVLLLSEAPLKEGAWPLHAQLEIARGREGDTSLQIKVLKFRGAPAWLQSVG